MSRSQLDNPMAMKVYKVSCVQEMLSTWHQGLRPGQLIGTYNYYEPSAAVTGLTGSGVFFWDDTRPKADHDGGSIISPTVPWDGTPDGLPAFLAGTGETDGGGTGCYVRIDRPRLSIEDFGAISDGSDGFDNWACLQTAVNRRINNPYGVTYTSGITIIPDGEYLIGQEINIKNISEVLGMYNNNGPGESCRLWFAVDSHGIIINDSDTFSDGVVAEGSDAAGTLLKGFSLRSLGGTTGHGLWMRARAKWENMKVRNFPENGFQILATANSADHREGNANNWVIQDCVAEDNDGHGFYVEGADANAGYAAGADGRGNGGYGIYDSSFLGNCWVGCHTANNGAGSYLSDNANARNTFVGCYAEGNQPAGSMAAPALFVGGFLTAPGITGSGITGKDGWLEDLAVFDGLLIYRAGHSGYRDYLRLHNQASSFSSIRHSYIQGECGYKTDGTTAWPAARLRFQPTSSDEDNPGAVIISTYNGETANTFTDVLSIWSNTVTPFTDNVTPLGGASNRWTEVFAANGTINTSDEREKQDIRPLSHAEKAVAMRLKRGMRAYRWREAVQAKQGAARIHVGAIAQEVIKAFAMEGLDAHAYGIVCYDEWEARPEMLDDDGNVAQEARPAGNRYGVRYDEMLAFIIAAL